MKFTKTVAEALARKVQTNLQNNRHEFINAYKPSEEIQKEIAEQVPIFVEARAALVKAREILEKYTYISAGNSDSVEGLTKYIFKQIASKEVPAAPSIGTLVDDFLIESLEAENAEELIAKITAKYVV